MKKLRFLAVVAALVGSAGLTEAATQLNLRVEGDAGAGWAEDIEVEAGQSVNYRVLGMLSNDDQNEGLALFGFDVSHSCGDLAQMAVSAAPCMDNFEIPMGITNPAGFGGTMNVPEHLGDLVQVGGAVNTILNDAGNAPYPTGAVCLGLGWTEVVLATGSLTIPGDAQDQDQCIVDLAAVFANVIAFGEVEDGSFWSVEPTDPGNVNPLTMTVKSVCVAAAFASSTPACEHTLPRIQGNVIRLQFAADISTPGPGELEIRELLPNGEFGLTDLSASFTPTVEGGNVLKLEESGSVLADGTWYAVMNTGGWPCVATFQADLVAVYGDSNDSNFNDFGDLSDIFGNQGPAADDNRFDVNASGFVDFGDISDAFGFSGSFASTKPLGHACTIP